MKKENYSFPVENELSKIRKKINNPAYLYKNKILLGVILTCQMLLSQSWSIQGSL